MLKYSDIPWKNLTTPYGRGTDIPDLIENRKYKKLNTLLEHQETLWQVTPWGVYFLLEQLEKDFALEKSDFPYEQMEIYELILISFEDIILNNFDRTKIFPDPLELISEKYLWHTPEDDDELYWEDEFPKGYDDISFFNIYYYSWKFIDDKRELFKKIINNTINQELSGFLQKLLNILDKISETV